MSVDIRIRNAVKRYGDNTIIPDLSLDIKEGEFFTLLGPSGCGKTTLLRMIAGFNTIEGGDFFFNEVRINDMDPVKRNIGMVFQNYAIFPHLTVEKNVAFGLKNRNLPKEEIAAKTDQFLKLVKIEEYRTRMPERLSGGQQQRVALARALAITPDVLLMDEPLSNLDAKLRVEMRTVIKEIQNEIGITTVYVTHDQEEAMAVSDRIAVMNEGIIQQIGIPKTLYQRPTNLFVASFIGRTNLIESRLEISNGKTFVHLPGAYKLQLDTISNDEKQPQDVILSIRPEELFVKPYEEEGVAAYVDDAVFLGLNTHYFIHFENGEKAEIIQESQIDSIIEKGTKISLGVKTDKINVFDSEGKRNLVEGVVNDLDLSDGAQR
ncbi:MAG: ABC transporter ATP-binding protein [Sphaerochaeta sp.]|jgi:iron(III) transport system ATP-binding protein|nr:ABC transporter ATP-binding protein [Sphaerochaeta sp.]